MRSLATQFVLALLAAAGGLAFAPAFGGRLLTSDFAPGALVAAVLTGAFVPALIVALARRLDLETIVAAAAGLVALAVAVVLVTRPGTAALSGGYRLLTSALPAQADGPACATIAALVGLASLIAALVAGYARLRALSVVPAFVGLLAALALDAGIRQPPVWYAAVVLVLLGAALALIREPLGQSQPAIAPSLAVRLARRGFPLVGAAAILAAGALLATALTSELPAVGHQAADARNLVPAPLKPRIAVNPMLQYPALAGGVITLELTGSSSRRLEQLTLVTLDGFTGQTWTTAAEFRRAGRILRDRRESPAVTVDIKAVNAGPLSWLLRPERPTSIDQDGLGIDESTGDIVVPGGVGYPARYRVTGTTPVRPTTALRSDTVLPGTGPVSTGTQPVPKSLRTFAGRTRVAKNDYVRLLSLQALLRSEGFYVDDTDDAPGGNGYFQLQSLIEARTKHIGTSEQYASAFAVMARTLGYDARLVLGFQPQYAKRGNAFTVTGDDIHAWAQVHFARAGWVTFDPTPTRPSSQAKARPNPAAANAAPSTPTSSSPSRAPPSSVAPSRSPQSQSGPASSITTLAVLVVLLVIVVLLLATPPSVKAARRRRRRGAPKPAHAVYGAWRETTDRLAEVGVASQRGRHTSEVADQSPRPVRDHVRALGRLLDRAGYAPEDAAGDDASAAWEHADETVRTLRGRMSPPRRVLAALDPRPLWRR